MIHTNAVILRLESLEVTGCGPVQLFGAGRIASLDMDESGCDLDEALIKIALIRTDFAPQGFQNFVGFKKFFLIEEAGKFGKARVFHFQSERNLARSRTPTPVPPFTQS